MNTYFCKKNKRQDVYGRWLQLCLPSLEWQPNVLSATGMIMVTFFRFRSSESTSEDIITWLFSVALYLKYTLLYSSPILTGLIPCRGPSTICQPVNTSCLVHFIVALHNLPFRCPPCQKADIRDELPLWLLFIVHQACVVILVFVKCICIYMIFVSSFVRRALSDSDSV